VIGHALRLVHGSPATFAFAVCVACGAPSAPIKPDFLGTATYVTAHGGEPLEIGLESFEQAERVYRIVWVYPSTRLTIRVGNQTSQPGSINDIVAGSTLLIKTDGAERRSDPAQYDAIWVEVVSRFER
jgi:hypothetical protein